MVHCSTVDKKHQLLGIIIEQSSNIALDFSIF